MQGEEAASSPLSIILFLFPQIRFRHFQLFGIRSIPTLLLLRQGREVARRPGAMDAGGIVNWTRQHLG